MEKRDTERVQRITVEIVESVLGLLEDEVYEIVLFGSYARGDFRVDSDMDIMVLVNCTKEKAINYRKQISRLASRLGLENDIEISLLIRDRETFERDKEVLPFYKNIKEEGVKLYG